MLQKEMKQEMQSHCDVLRQKGTEMTKRGTEMIEQTTNDFQKLLTEI